jgi:ribosomal protein S18 acetylase RimI-like enzyme
MVDVILRSAEAHDVPAVLAFWKVAAEDAHRPVDTPSGLATLHLRDPDALILAVDGNEIVGTVIAGWDGWRCHLYRLAVDPSRRGAGIGRALIGAAEERFRILGGSRVDAMVLDDNTRAHHIWRGCGYRLQPEWSRWVKPLRSSGQGAGQWPGVEDGKA